MKRIIIIDNNSSDNSLNILEKKYGKKYIIIRNKENLGYARGNNIGIQKSTEVGMKYSFIINPDVEILDFNIFDTIIKFGESMENFYIAGPNIIHHNNFYYVPFYKRPDLLDLIFPFILRIRNKKRNNNSTIQEVYALHGSFLLIDTNKFKKIGMFDSRTFLYNEENIIGEKLLKLNVKSYIIKNLYIKHSVAKSVDAHFSFLKFRYMFESLFVYLTNYRNININSAYTISIISIINRVINNFIRKILYFILIKVVS